MNAEDLASLSYFSVATLSITFYYMDYDMWNGMSFHVFSPVYDVETIGFYKLHHCSSNGTNEFFKD